ncbi:Integrase core domain-containing protein [Prauserella aidingensis]|nr:Integrase core domain-containing protein [Prauserella aidingensis]
MFHGSARLTVHGRRLIVQRHQAGWKQAHIAAAMGVSRKCVKTWIDRYATEGEPGLATRSSRPHTSPTRTPDDVEQRVLDLRHRERRGQDWIGPEFGVPPRTVARILRRHEAPYLTECDPITGDVIRASRATGVRYERERPGELTHMDVKKFGKIPDGGGWRVHGRSEGVRARGNGYDYVHSLVDDHSRLAYSEILPDEKGPTCAAFLRRAAAYFADHGIPHRARDHR